MSNSIFSSLNFCQLTKNVDPDYSAPSRAVKMSEQGLHRIIWCIVVLVWLLDLVYIFLRVILFSIYPFCLFIGPFCS